MSAPELPVRDVAAALAAGAVAVVDVREQGEWLAGHIEQATWIPMGELVDRAGELPAAPLAIVCRSGVRSGMVADWLVGSGIDASNVTGGMVAWREASLPIVPPDGFVA
jgi:rhodanese-related sulfurtransferase